MKSLRACLRTAVCAVALVVFGLSAAHAASTKILYQSPPEGILLNADPNKKLQELSVLNLSSYSSVRVVAHVRASSIGTNKVDVELFHADPYLTPYASSPTLEFPLWNKSLGNDAATSTTIDHPGAKVSLKVSVNAASGESYVIDLIVYGFK